MTDDERRPVLHGEVQEPGGGSGYDRGGFRFETRTWNWDDGDIRRGLPWMGVFLVAFGAILLLGTAFPSAHILGSALTTALGVALLASWATGRGWGLYPGLLITAYSLPGLLVDLSLIPAGGGRGLMLGTACSAWPRALERPADLGWQLVVGGILALAGGRSRHACPGVPGPATDRAARAHPDRDRILHERSARAGRRTSRLTLRDRRDVGRDLRRSSRSPRAR
jgi:hypothetical protein